MIPDKSIFKNRMIQLIGLLITVQLFLIFEHILPAYDKIPYFQSKIETTKQEMFNLEINHDHLSFYQEKKKDSHARLEEYQAHFKRLNNSSYLQNQINILSQHNKLEVINQQFQTDKSNPDLLRIIVSLSLKGYYKQLITFIDEAGKLDSFIAISEIEMNNQSPLSENPEILTKVILTVYLPNIT